MTCVGGGSGELGIAITTAARRPEVRPATAMMSALAGGKMGMGFRPTACALECTAHLRSLGKKLKPTRVGRFFYFYIFQNRFLQKYIFGRPAVGR